MEANILRKIILYFAAAILAGLAITLIPLIASAEINVRSDYILMPEYLTQHPWQAEEDYDLSSTRYSINTEIFVISFAIALVAFLWVRRKTPHDYSWMRMPPF
jgi:hypothetical protein